MFQAEAAHGTAGVRNLHAIDPFHFIAQRSCIHAELTTNLRQRGTLSRGKSPAYRAHGVIQRRIFNHLDSFP